ncbi:hypothetical protein [Pseudalkalibacillus hwajinpoensis]|uniref:hypothetical protein n=1 Tax=Guptibacillus hwajinpoensis TaxID=208199 RepID=UPI001CD2F3BE|nr:hypothetical protein [Pseudalkalibacillus hwajinpoensis]MCA0993730.1 hypothetical protein [Pseudalkalibacillus hwajinpoensis]
MGTPELSRDDLKLTELSYIKINALMLLMILPLSVIGYQFAVSNEEMFFVYEWALVVLVLISFILAGATSIIYNSSNTWLSYAILSFDLQFAVFGLFMGPYTFYKFFFVYYLCAAIALIIWIITLKKVKVFRYLIVIFIIVTVLLTSYMLLLQNLWGMNWM